MTLKEQFAQLSENRPYTARLGDYWLRGPKLSRGFRKWSIAGATATLEAGVPQRGHRSLTRVAVGTAILPGVGTLIGGMSRKQAKTVRIYVTIQLADSAIVIDVPGKDESQARTFVATVNAAGRHFTQ